jgi:hypothetical protein
MILLCVLIAWVTFGLLFVGQDLIFLLMIEHASNTSQATIVDERISDQASSDGKADLAVNEPVLQSDDESPARNYAISYVWDIQGNLRGRSIQSLTVKGYRELP